MNWSSMIMISPIKSGFLIFSQNNSGIYSVCGNSVVEFAGLNEIPLDVIFISNSKESIKQYPNIKRTNFYGTSIQSIIKLKGLTFSAQHQVKDLSKLVYNITSSFIGLTGLDIEGIFEIEYASDFFVKTINSSDQVKKLNMIAPPANISLIPLVSSKLDNGDKLFGSSFDILKHSKYMFSCKIPVGNWVEHNVSGKTSAYASKLMSSKKFGTHSFVFTIKIISVPGNFYNIIDILDNNNSTSFTGNAIKFLIKNGYQFKIINAWSSRSVRVSSIASKFLNFTIPKTSSIFIPSDIIGYLSVSIWKAVIFINNSDNNLVEMWLNDWNNIVLLNSLISSGAHDTIKISKISNNKISLIANNKTAPYLLKKLGVAGLTPNPDLISFVNNNK